MELIDLIKIVRKMRDAQKSYFMYRDKNSLQRSIMLEKIVDDELTKCLDEQLKAQQEQSLFG